MTLENGQQNTEHQHPEKLRNEIDRGEGATTEETEPAIEQETRPVTGVARTPNEKEDTKKAIFWFTLTTVLVLIALALIYAFWR